MVRAWRRTRWPAVLVLIVAAACVSPACSGSTARARPSPWWAGVRTPGATQAGAFRGMPGSVAYRCVRVGSRRDVRSGGFLAGNFGAGEQLFAAAYQESQRHSEVKIYWIPLQVDRMSELAVQATLLGGQRVTRTYHQNQVGTAGGVVFYPSGVPIPVPGTWKLVAAAGPNRGCFIVTFLASPR
jgi:hypothetical protein